MTVTGTAQVGNGQPLIEVDNVCKYFGSVIALQDVSMFARVGEVTCLLGDNGAGKSTLIKILSGVHKPDEGYYIYDGEKTDFASPRDALGRGDRHRLSGSGDDRPDVDLAELLPRVRAHQGVWPLPPL